MPLPVFPPIAITPPAIVSFVSRETKASAGRTISIEEMRLPNGLRVLFAPDHSAPVVAVNVTYDVGSRNERPGRTGFAHLFEHMMFQGSENVGKGEHILLLTGVGGSMNGTTNEDRTNYFETVPRNQLKLALFLEADRMRSLDVSLANVDNQRSVVQEEKRQSYDNRAYGQVDEVLQGLAYTNFAYQHTTIGSMADLNAATIDDVRSFFATYYAPNNAVLTVTGDFDTNTAKQLVRQYFGPISSKPAPPAVDVSEPTRFKAGERRKKLTDPLARQTRLTYGYVTVPGDDPDFYPLRLLGIILSEGRSGRLYKALVETNMAINAGGRMSEGRGPSLFTITATLPPGKTGDAATAPIEQVIESELARIEKDGVTPDELERAITRERVSLAGQYRTALSRASAISLFTVYYNDPNRINTMADRLAKVTREQIQAVAVKYLQKENRSVVIVDPALDLDVSRETPHAIYAMTKERRP